MPVKKVTLARKININRPDELVYLIKNEDGVSEKLKVKQIMKYDRTDEFIYLGTERGILLTNIPASYYKTTEVTSLIKIAPVIDDKFYESLKTI